MGPSDFRAPPLLRPGDVVRLVAPAGPVDEQDLEVGLDVLRRRYEVRVDPGVRARKGYLAGDDERRARELLLALGEPGVRAIVAIRGGYGTMRILPRVAPALRTLADDPRVIVGSSDLTALGSALLCAGLGWVHGPMVSTLGRIDQSSRERLFRILEEPSGPDESDTGLRPVAPGRATGPVIGGNLSILGALAGTPYLPSLRDSILFLEDVGEKPYRIDRLATQLELAGALEGLVGVILGDFVDCSGTDGSEPAEAVLADRFRGIPIVAGFPAAHGARCHAMRMGAVARIDGDRGTLEWV